MTLEKIVNKNIVLVLIRSKKSIQKARTIRSQTREFLMTMMKSYILLVPGELKLKLKLNNQITKSLKLVLQNHNYIL